MRNGQPAPISEETKSRFLRARRSIAGALLLLMGILAAESAQASADLVLIPSPLTLISLIVLFIVLIFPLNALVFRPVFETLDERDRRIAGARERADEVSKEADEVFHRYRTELSAARSAAEQSRREAVETAREEQARVTTAARTEAEQKVEQGRSELMASLEAARSDMGSHVRELADAAAQQILGRAL